MANYAGNLVISGLGTFVLFQAPEAGPYFVDGKISIPTLSNGGGVSAVVATLTKNGASQYVGIAGAEGFFLSIALAAGDTMRLVLSSANAVDNGYNSVKTTVAFGEGI